MQRISDNRSGNDVYVPHGDSLETCATALLRYLLPGAITSGNIKG